MNSSEVKLFENFNANADFTSDAFDVSRAEASALQVGNIASANLEGSMKLEVTNDPTLGWNDLPLSIQAFQKTAATAKSNIWDLTQYGFKKFRFVWTYTAGAGTLTGVINSKG